MHRPCCEYCVGSAKNKSCRVTCRAAVQTTARGCRRSIVLLTAGSWKWFVASCTRVRCHAVLIVCRDGNTQFCSQWQICIWCLVVCWPSLLWPCWLGGRKGIQPVKNWVVGCWRVYLSGAWCRLAYGQLIPLPLTVSCFSKIQIGLPFWYRLTRVKPEKGPLNGCVCVYFVCLSVGHDCELCRDAVWDVHSLGSKDSCITWGPRSPWEGARAQTCPWLMHSTCSTLFARWQQPIAATACC